MDARSPVDGFRPDWSSFAAFLAARGDGDARFLTELDHESGIRREWSVQAWRGRVARTAHWLLEQGVGPGAAVATLAGNSADALALAYACWARGACCVPLNPGDAPDRQRYILRDAAAVLLVHSPGWRERAAELAPDVSGPVIEVSALPAHEDGEAPVIEAALPDGEPLDVPALRVYTSGTTGEPKGVVLTASSLLTDCDGLAERLGWDASTRVLTVLPIHHVNGLVISSLLPWYAGGSTVLCDRFRSDRFWDDVASEGATVCSMVPTLLEFLLRSPGSPSERFREVLSAAGPLLVETVLEFESRFGVPVRHLYGLSETTAISCCMPALDRAERMRWHRDFGFPCIGPALAHVEMAVLDTTGAALPAGARGELGVRGSVLLREYAGRPDATAEALRDGWFHTGDEGFWIEGPGGEPFYFITGRVKELIIRGGVNISPFEVDEVLRSHPAVRHALAVPFDNRFYGEEVAAYVVAASPVSEAEILAHCARHLDFSRQPKVVLFGEDLPYTVTGKPKRLELKSRLAPELDRYRETQFRKPRPTQEITR